MVNVCGSWWTNWSSLMRMIVNGRYPGSRSVHDEWSFNLGIGMVPACSARCLVRLVYLSIYLSVSRSTDPFSYFTGNTASICKQSKPSTWHRSLSIHLRMLKIWISRWCRSLGSSSPGRSCRRFCACLAGRAAEGISKWGGILYGHGVALSFTSDVWWWWMAGHGSS